MRHSLLLCSIACLIISGVANFASAQIDTLWTKVLDLGTANVLQAAIELRSGGFAAAGYLSSGGFDDALIVKVGPLGDTLWTRSLGDPGFNDRAYDIAELTNGTLVICGSSLTGLSSFAAGYSPTGEQLWRKIFDPAGQSGAFSVLPTEDGGFWILARKQENGLDDFWLIRCIASGDSLFSRNYGTPRQDFPDQVRLGLGGNLELVGSSRDTVNQQFDFFHVTTDADGNFIRQQAFGTDDFEQVYGAMVDSVTGEVTIVGEFRDVSSNRDAHAIRLDASGTQLWDQNYTAGRQSERLGGVAPYLEGGALMAGQTGETVNSGQLWLLSVGVSGDTLWTWTGPDAGRGFEDLRRIADGGFVACGRANIGNQDRGLLWRISPPSGVSGFVRDRVTGEEIQGVRVEAAGLPQYAMSDTLGRFTLALPPGVYTIYSGGACFTGDTLHGIEVTVNENTTSDITVGVAHMSQHYSSINVVAANHQQGEADMIVKNAGSGDLVYAFEYFSQIPAGNWLSVEPASGRVAPGDSLVAHVLVDADTTDDGTYDYFGEIRLHTNSCPDTVVTIQVLAVVLDAESGPELPSEFALYPAFPNPFNSTTTLRFGLDRESNVSLKIYDVTGRLAATPLGNQKLSAGEHNISFTAEGLATGLYFVRLQDDTRSQTQRLLYLR